MRKYAIATLVVALLVGCNQDEVKKSDDGVSPTEQQEDRSMATRLTQMGLIKDDLCRFEYHQDQTPKFARFRNGEAYVVETIYTDSEHIYGKIYSNTDFNSTENVQENEGTFTCDVNELRVAEAFKEQLPIYGVYETFFLYADGFQEAICTIEQATLIKTVRSDDGRNFVADLNADCPGIDRVRYKFPAPVMKLIPQVGL